MWSAWDYAADMCLEQLPALRAGKSASVSDGCSRDVPQQSLSSLALQCSEGSAEQQTADHPPAAQRFRKSHRASVNQGQRQQPTQQHPAGEQVDQRRQLPHPTSTWKSQQNPEAGAEQLHSGVLNADRSAAEAAAATQQQPAQQGDVVEPGQIMAAMGTVTAGPDDRLIAWQTPDNNVEKAANT